MFENVIKFVLMLWISLLHKDLPLCEAVNRLSFLGMKEYSVDSVVNIMELFRIFENSYNIFRRSPYKIKARNLEDEDEITGSREALLDSKKKPPEVRNFVAFSYSEAQIGTNFTDLHVIMLTKYMASIYALQFVYGHVYFKEHEQNEEAKMAAQIANYMAWYGVSFADEVVAAIHRIMEEKLPDESQYFFDIVDKFQLFQIVVQGTVADLYDPKTQTFGEYNKFNFLKHEEFEHAVKELNNYFARMIFEESEVYTLNDETQREVLSQFPVMNIMGGEIVWNETKTLYNFMNKKHDKEMKEELENGIAKYKCNIITMLRHLELKKAARKFKFNVTQTLNLKKGLEKEMLVMKRRVNNSKKPAVCFKRIRKQMYQIPAF